MSRQCAAVADGRPLKTVTPVTARSRGTLTIGGAMFDEVEQVILREMERSGLPGPAIALVKGHDTFARLGRAVCRLEGSLVCCVLSIVRIAVP